MCEWTSRPDERITGPPIERMTLTPRSGATCANRGPRSGYRHLADGDDVPGSSPGRPTTSDNQRER